MKKDFFIQLERVHKHFSKDVSFLNKPFDNPKLRPGLIERLDGNDIRSAADISVIKSISTMQRGFGEKIVNIKESHEISKKDINDLITDFIQLTKKIQSLEKKERNSVHTIRDTINTYLHEEISELKEINEKFITDTKFALFTSVFLDLLSRNIPSALSSLITLISTYIWTDFSERATEKKNGYILKLKEILLNRRAKILAIGISGFFLYYGEFLRYSHFNNLPDSTEYKEESSQMNFDKNQIVSSYQQNKIYEFIEFKKEKGISFEDLMLLLAVIMNLTIILNPTYVRLFNEQNKLSEFEVSLKYIQDPDFIKKFIELLEAFQKNFNNLDQAEDCSLMLKKFTTQLTPLLEKKMDKHLNFQTMFKSVRKRIRLIYSSGGRTSSEKNPSQNRLDRIINYQKNKNQPLAEEPSLSELERINSSVLGQEIREEGDYIDENMEKQKLIDEIPFKLLTRNELVILVKALGGQVNIKKKSKGKEVQSGKGSHARYKIPTGNTWAYITISEASEFKPTYIRSILFKKRNGDFNDLDPVKVKEVYKKYLKVSCNFQGFITYKVME